MSKTIKFKSNEESNLYNYLKNTLGENNLIKDSANRTYNINYDSLIKEFPFNNLKSAFRNKNLTIKTLYLYLKGAVSFNHSESKTGTVTYIFPMIFAMYDVKYLSESIKINNYMYDVCSEYDWLKIDQKIQDIIEPQKLAFKIADIARENVTITFKNELFVYFEVDFKDSTKKKYDIGIALPNKEFVIMIEIQEHNKSHDNNINDKNKEEIVHSKGMLIKHFFQDEMKDSDYEKNFYAELLNDCYEVLIVSSENFRNKNLLKEAQIKSKEKIEKLEKELEKIDPNSIQYELKKDYIIELEYLINDEDNTVKQMKILYQYKVDAYNDENKYNIPLDVVLDNIDLKINIDSLGDEDKNKQDQLIDDCILKFTSFINNNYYFTYETVLKFLYELNIIKIKKLINHYVNILLCTQEIYEYYINIIVKHNNLVINKLKEDNQLIMDIIKDNLENQYKLANERKDIKIKRLESQLKNLRKENNIKSQKDIEMQFINDEPIIDADYCELYYSDDSNNRVSSLDALATLENYGINTTKAKEILQTLYKKQKGKVCKLYFTEDNEFIKNLYFNTKQN